MFIVFIERGLFKNDVIVVLVWMMMLFVYVCVDDVFVVFL